MRKTYRNIFAEMGIDPVQVDKRLREICDLYGCGQDV